MTAADDDLLWPEQVAAYLGWSSADYPRQRAYQTRLRREAGAAPRPTDFPLPVESSVRREVPARPARRTRSTQATRVVSSSRWRRGDLDAYREAVRAERAAKINRIRNPATGRMEAKVS